MMNDVLLVKIRKMNPNMLVTIKETKGRGRYLVIVVRRGLVLILVSIRVIMLVKNAMTTKRVVSEEMRFVNVYRSG